MCISLFRIKPVIKIYVWYSFKSLSSKYFPYYPIHLCAKIEYSNEIFQKVISNHEPPLRERFGERGKRGPYSRMTPPAAISHWKLEIEFRRRTRGFLIRIWGFSRNLCPYIRPDQVQQRNLFDFTTLKRGAGRCGKEKRKSMVGQGELKVATTDTKRKRETMETNWWKRAHKGFINRRKLTTPARACVQDVSIRGTIKIKDL